MDASPPNVALGHRFADPALIRLALTHRSHGANHNERLEFLGDAVLNCIIADEIYRRFPHLPEGDLSRVRANLVRQQTLFEVATGLGLGPLLLLGDGELRSGGQERPSILADTLEALIGAIYLDSGFDAARTVVGRLFAPLLDATAADSPGKDPKTLLQEFLQGRRLALPQYAVVGTVGAAHRQLFRVECCIPQLGIRTEGEGSSRRAAEEQAAELAYRLALDA